MRRQRREDSERNDPPLETIGVVVHKVQRLCFLRTRRGPSVINDESQGEEPGLKPEHLEIGDFVAVRMVKTPLYKKWAGENKYTTISFRRIPPPNGVTVEGHGRTTKIICPAKYRTRMENNAGEVCEIFESEFVDMIYDIKCTVNRPDPEAIYTMRIAIDRVRQYAGTEFIIEKITGVRYKRDDSDSVGSELEPRRAPRPDQQTFQARSEGFYRQLPYESGVDSSRSGESMVVPKSRPTGVSEFTARRAPYVDDDTPPPRTNTRAAEEPAYNEEGRRRLASRFGVSAKKDDARNTSSSMRRKEDRRVKFNTSDYSDDELSSVERPNDGYDRRARDRRVDTYDNAYDNARRYDDRDRFAMYPPPPPSNANYRNHEVDATHRKQDASHSEKPFDKDKPHLCYDDYPVAPSDENLHKSSPPPPPPPSQTVRQESEEELKYKALFYRLWMNSDVRKAVEASGGTLLKDIQTRLNAERRLPN